MGDLIMEIVKENISKRRWIILFVVIIMTFMSCLDGSIVNIALPVMSKKLSVTMAEIEWVVAGYVMVISSTLLIFGRLGDIRSKTKVFKWGMVLFTAGSFLCGISKTFTLLIVFRILQGIGASAYMANNQGIITQIFEKNERGKALGILAAAVALGNMVGPSIGGFIISSLSWNYIFLINVPIGIAAFIFALKILPNGRATYEKVDIKGAFLFFVSIMLLFGSLIQEQRVGYKNPIIIISFILGIVCMGLFIVIENKIDIPLLDLKIFKNGLFSLSLICAFISFICISASIIIIPFYLQDTLKISAFHAGLFMMISPFVVAVISPLMGSLADKIGAEVLTLSGLALMSGGFFAMSFLKEHSSLVSMGIFIVIIALGQGFFQPANNTLIMSSAPKDRLGIAGSVNSLVRNLGQIVGITLSTTLLYNFMSIKLGHHVVNYTFGRDDVFIYGMKYVYICLAVVCLLGIGFTAVRLFNIVKD